MPTIPRTRFGRVVSLCSAGALSRVRGNSYHSNAGYTENKSVTLNAAIEHIAINLFHIRQCDYMWIFLETRLEGS